jgi:hypothetical protein
LHEHGVDGTEDQLATIVRWNDDRDGGGHFFLDQASVI